MLAIGIIIAVIGLLLIVSFIFSRLRCNEKTEATVSKVSAKKIYLRGRIANEYTPVFTYFSNGKKYTAKSDISTFDAKRYSVGDKATVYIDAKHPETMRYGSNVSYLIAGIVLAALGIFIIVLAL